MVIVAGSVNAGALVSATVTTKLDDDPFVDVRTGFITGATPKDAEAFVERIAAAGSGLAKLPGAFVDDLGPPEQGEQKYFNAFPLTHFVPVIGKRYSVKLWLPEAPTVSVAVTVKEKLPGTVGVPERTPLLLRVRPVGSVPAVVAKLLLPVPPDALIVWL